MGGDGTNITVKNTDKKEQTNTSVGSSSSSSSENETPENFDKMEKGRHNSDCGQEPGDVDIIKEKMSKMKPVSVTEQAEKRSALFEELAETNKTLIELEQEQSNLVPKNIEVYSPEFIEALSSYDETVGLADLEEKLISSFANGDSWREGTEKTSFNYLLLDPRVTQDLPSRMDSLGKVESFKVFVAAIFYVGKGERARPLDHLIQAISQMEKTKTQVSEKVKHILDIWSDNVGVVSLHCFQNTIPDEAYTREACMIDAIMSVGADRLTNRMRGTYYGISKTWCMKEKRNMGFYFLKKALKIFKEEGERQVFPGDLKGGQ